MREWIFLLFLLSSILSLSTNPFLGLAILPSVLLSWWVWQDGNEIECLHERIDMLVREVNKIACRSE